VSAEPTNSRPALGLPPRRTAAPAAEAPLARMFPGHRPETPKKPDPKDADITNMTVCILAALRNRARAAYRATSYAEGDNTWSHFVVKAIESRDGPSRSRIGIADAASYIEQRLRRPPEG
jgi:hypothetical protein